MNNLMIKLVEGTLAPRYEAGVVKEVEINTAVITEQGTEKGLPIVDFQMTDADGKQYFGAMTGRLVLTLAAALRGVNLRNHGVEEP